MTKILVTNKSFTESAGLRLKESEGATVNTGSQAGAVHYQTPYLDIGLAPAKAALPTIMRSINRFEPMYWRVDGPNTASFSIVNYGNGWEATFDCRSSDDLIGVVWDSENTKDHASLRYSTNRDYRGLKWDFDIELSPSMPMLNDEILAPTLTVEYFDAVGRKSYAYIALKNYADLPNSRSAHISIDWDTVKGGFEGKTAIDVRNVEKIFFSGYVDAYNKVTPVMLPQTTAGYIRVTNSVTSGNGAKLNINHLELEKHDIGVCTSYDDHYDLNPARIVYNLSQLGYNGFINHYCGMSHYPVIDWNFETNKFETPDPLVDGREVVTAPCKNWHMAFAKALKSNGFNPVFSVSWELYSLGAREEWCQREYDDSIARTGYTPPSYFASLCNTHAIEYLNCAYREFADVLLLNELEINMQIGEPWWWFNTKTLNPCVYDYQTRLAFNADTGLYAPDLGTIIEAVDKNDATSVAFKNWLRDKLGMTCRNIRTMLKETYGESTKVCPLIFFPSIRTHQVSLATYINYPQEHYSYPNFDYIMTEAYDWVIEQPPRLDLSHSAVSEIPIGELKYPPNKVAYLTGFVPDNQIAYIYKFNIDSEYRSPIWQRMFGDIENNKSVGIMKQLLWAYPQVMADSLTIVNKHEHSGFFLGNKVYKPITDNTPYPDSIVDPNATIPAVPEVQKPLDVALKRTSNNDHRISFNVANERLGSTFAVQILDSNGLYPVLSKTASEHHVWIYASEWESVISSPTVRIIVVPSEGDASDLVDLEAELDDSIATVVLDVSVQRIGSEEDITVSWTTLNGVVYPKYLVEQYSVLDGSKLYERIVTDTLDKFTAAEQRAVYGFLASVTRTRVTPLNEDGVAIAPSVTQNGSL